MIDILNSTEHAHSILKVPKAESINDWDAGKRIGLWFDQVIRTKLLFYRLLLQNYL